MQSVRESRFSLKRCSTFRTGAKIYLSEKNILGLGALLYSPGIFTYFCFHPCSFVIPTAKPCWRCQGGDEDEKQEDCLHVGTIVGKRKCRPTDSGCFLSEKAEYLCWEQNRNGEGPFFFVK